MTNRLLLTLLIISAAILFQGCSFPLCGFAGSYPCVQSWNIEASENDLTTIIKEVKKENPALQPPGDTSLTARRHSYWLFVNFYYSDTEEIVHAWIRKDSYSSPPATTLALVGFSQANNPKNHREINRDFKWKENKAQIKKFKATILAPIRQKTEVHKKR